MAREEKCSRCGRLITHSAYGVRMYAAFVYIYKPHVSYILCPECANEIEQFIMKGQP